MTEPCIMQEVIRSHEGALGEIKSTLGSLAQDVSHIKMRVDDGLSTKIERIDKELAKSIANGRVAAEEIKADVEIRASDLRGENWLNRIVTGSVTKLIGIGVVFILLSALTNSGIGLLIKEKYSLELPGQQKEIMKTQAVIASTLNVYHTHELSDGRTLYHAGDSDKPAWILDPKIGAWQKVPGMRTEAGIK